MLQKVAKAPCSKAWPAYPSPAIAPFALALRLRSRFEEHRTRISAYPLSLARMRVKKIQHVWEHGTRMAWLRSIVQSSPGSWKSCGPTHTCWPLLRFGWGWPTSRFTKLWVLETSTRVLWNRSPTTFWGSNLSDLVRNILVSLTVSSRRRYFGLASSLDKLISSIITKTSAGCPTTWYVNIPYRSNST